MPNRSVANGFAKERSNNNGVGCDDRFWPGAILGDLGRLRDRYRTH
jgi:hypothetical protein